MKTDNRQKILIIAVAVMAAVLVGDKLIVSPLTKMWDKRQKEIAALRTKVTEGRALVRREDVLQERWREMRKNMLPNDSSRAQEQLLNAIQEWAQESSVSINAITPQWKESDTDNYRTLVCRIDASGTLWMLSRFIYDIEKGPLGLKLESVDITSRDNTGRQISLGLQLSGLVLMPNSK
jgi:Pilus assembly protein, PilO.